jgi:hypothetical protein
MKSCTGSDRRLSRRALIGIFALVVSSILSAAAVQARAVFDFDGDGKTDYGVVRARFSGPNWDPKEWYVLMSGGGEIAEIFGNTTGNSTRIWQSRRITTVTGNAISLCFAT